MSLPWAQCCWAWVGGQAGAAGLLVGTRGRSQGCSRGVTPLAEVVVVKGGSYRGSDSGWEETS